MYRCENARWCTAAHSLGSHIVFVFEKQYKIGKRDREMGEKKRDSEIPEIPFTLYFIFGLGLGKKRSQDVKIAPLILS